jgi:cytochrome c oxidase cbb3-type subunit 3
MKKYAALIVSFVPALLQAQTTGAMSLTDVFMYMIAGVVAVTLGAALWILYRTLMTIVKSQERRLLREQGIEEVSEEVSAAESTGESLWQKWYDALTGAVPVTQERDVMLDHDYDGIRELDNKLPPWWVAMFYITIIWGLGYMVYYHVGSGPGSYDEFVEEMRQAEEDVAAFLAGQASQVDESNVQFLTDASAMANGMNIYMNNCAVCHGQQGEGGVGPNLTDNYFVHGGSIQDVFKVIKYGVPERGMISWKAQIRPQDMQDVASYVLSLVGTNPPNPKDSEGTLYEPETTDDSDDDQAVGGTSI